MTLFRSAFPYLASIIIRILLVELIVISDYKHLSTYKLINNSTGLTILYVTYLNS